MFRKAGSIRVYLLGEPGFEDRETIAHGLEVAAKSGFTGIALQPNSFPVMDNQSQIQFVQSKAQHAATQLFPIGALTKESLGKDLAELYDMKKAGAIAFGDYIKIPTTQTCSKSLCNMCRILMVWS